MLLHTCRGHQQSVTCVCISNDNKYAFTGSKDCSIIKCKHFSWRFNREITFELGCLITGKKLHLIRRIAKTEQSIVGHFDHILAITISTDGQFLVKILNEKESMEN